MRTLVLIIFAIMLAGTVKAQENEKLSIKDSLKHVEKMAKIEAELEIARINADKPIIESPGVTVGFGGGFFNPFFNSFYNRPFYNDGFYNNGFYNNRRPIIIKRRRYGNNRNNVHPRRSRSRSRSNAPVRVRSSTSKNRRGTTTRTQNQARYRKGSRRPAGKTRSNSSGRPTNQKTRKN